MKKLIFMLLAMIMTLSVIPRQAFADSIPQGLQYSISNGEVTITGYTGTATELVIPATIEGNLVTKIRIHAFYKCTTLVRVEISEGVSSIGDGAFSECTNLKSIKMPQGITHIGSGAFGDCTSLTSVDLPKGITTIEENTFNGCSKLKDVTIPEGVKNIKHYAFVNCSELKNVSIPKEVTFIDRDAFFSCDQLTNIYYTGTITQWSVLKESNNWRLLAFSDATIHYHHGQEHTYGDWKIGDRSRWKVCSDCYYEYSEPLTSISVTTMPNKLSYMAGEYFDRTGMVVTACYNNNCYVVINDYSCYVDTSTPGTQTVTVTFGEKSTSFTINVVAKSVTSIAITRKPDKLTYWAGEDFLNTVGMVVTAYYNNNTSGVVYDYTVSGYSSTPGTKTITVTYGGKTATFTVTVVSKSLEFINVNPLPNKLTYVEGEAFDTSGMFVMAYYDDYSSSVVYDYNISGYDSTPGRKTITITYGGKTDSFNVVVEENPIELVSISVTQKPYKLIYKQGEELDLSGLVVTAYYDNNTSAVLEEYTVLGYNDSPGNHFISVYHNWHIDSFMITVEGVDSGDPTTDSQVPATTLRVVVTKSRAPGTNIKVTAATSQIPATSSKAPAVGVVVSSGSQAATSVSASKEVASTAAASTSQTQAPASTSAAAFTNAQPSSGSGSWWLVIAGVAVLAIGFVGGLLGKKLIKKK